MKKKLLLLLCIVTMVSTGCDKDSQYAEEAAALAGTYTGTFVTTGTTKDGSATISQNTVLPNDLLFDYVIDLKRIAENRYECDGSTSLTAEALSTMMTLCGLTSSDFEGTVNKITVDARFNGDQLNMTITYMTDLGISVNSIFTGTKE
ncbi:MAG: hypothetical protein PHQ33_02900 [Bacteroidales bacterium]|nr:hypothetical protein [Bacteroidales bacterium]